MSVSPPVSPWEAAELGHGAWVLGAAPVAPQAASPVYRAGCSQRHATQS